MIEQQLRKAAEDTARFDATLAELKAQRYAGVDDHVLFEHRKEIHAGGASRGFTFLVRFRDDRGRWVECLARQDGKTWPVKPGGGHERRLASNKWAARKFEAVYKGMHLTPQEQSND